ncbi:MAG TPA: anti-sigma factor [Miltoncostaeaceae bacterium]|nr:anti-sigma factor [Miltoncostaeaceae bacterium]
MNVHDDVQDLLAPLALGAAAPEEERMVLAHIDTCAICRLQLEELRAAVTTIALDVTPHEPRPELKRAVMSVVEREASLRAPREAPAAGLRERMRALLPQRAGLWPALAGVLAAVAIGAGVWTVSAGDGTPDSRVVTAETRLPGVQGEAVLVDGGGRALVELSGLPPLAPGRGYQLWVIDASGTPRSAGFMAVSPQGPNRVYAVTEDLAGATALAVTREALTNRVGPTETPIVTLPLPA